MRMGALAVLLVGALAPFLSIGAVSAQCVGGRVANEQTQGRCCWPGQSFNAETAVCTGPPTCPAGTVAHGDDCAPDGGGLAVPPGPEGGAGAQAGTEAGAVQADGTVQGSAQATPDGVPTAPAGYGAAPAGQPYAAQPQGYGQVQPGQPQALDGEQYTGETRMVVNKGLLIPGIITFSVSYGIAVFSAIVAEYGFLAIPIAGPFILMTEVNSYSSDANLAYAGLAIWGLAQTAGIVLTILGLTLKREVAVTADLGNGRSIAVMPTATPGGGGLLLQGTL